LVLAERQVCPLLTGDKALRAAATREGVVVHGTLWLAEEMFKAGVLDVEGLKAAFEEMLRRGRRLPYTSTSTVASTPTITATGV
jgi:hypothetical protein